MTKFRLPNGVPADNVSKPSSSPQFSGPDTSAPRFSGAADTSPGREGPPVQNQSFSSAYHSATSEDAPKNDSAGLGALPQKIAGVVIVLLLGFVALMVIAANDDSTPSCSDRPAWNQFDCRMD